VDTDKHPPGPKLATALDEAMLAADPVDRLSARIFRITKTAEGRMRKAAVSE
jgi:hypothetical protein